METSNLKLKNKWVLWFHKINDNTWRLESYQRLCEVETYNDLVFVMNTLKNITAGMFFFMKDGLHVHKFAVTDLKINVYPQKLLYNHWQIEIIGVVASKIAIAHELVELGRKFPKSGHVFDVGLINTMYFAGFSRNWHFGIDALVQHLTGAIGHGLEHSYFYNAVGSLIEACGFEVKKGERTLEI